MQRNAGGVVTLRFAIPTPLSPLENHIDQYRYASIRSRDILLAPARQPLPVFHVKPKSYSSDAPFSTGDRPHLPLPAPRLQHGGARRRVKAGSDPHPQVDPLCGWREALVSAHSRIHECSRHHSHQRPRCHDLGTLTHHETTNHSHLGRLSVRRCQRASV